MIKNPICLITGATEGLGNVTALEVAKKGFTIVVAARNSNKAQALIKEIETATGNTTCDYIMADLRSLRQVHQLAETFRRHYSHLDVLINNAGVFLPTCTETEDGYEAMFQVNYLSPFLLTNLLLNELQRSEQGRIISVSSSVYAATKLFMLMFTEELARRLKATSVTVNAVHPGIVRTRMMLHAPGALRLLSYLSLPFSISPFHGAQTSVYLASSPEVNGISGKYFTKSRIAAVKNKFDTAKKRALLWDLTVDAADARPITPVRRAS